MVQISNGIIVEYFMCATMLWKGISCLLKGITVEILFPFSSMLRKVDSLFSVSLYLRKLLHNFSADSKGYYSSVTFNCKKGMLMTMYM
jgi:hypothetical protein